MFDLLSCIVLTKTMIHGLSPIAIDYFQQLTFLANKPHNAHKCSVYLRVCMGRTRGIVLTHDSLACPPLILPWPPSILRPNNKSHWAQKMPAKNAFKLACHFAAKQYPVNIETFRIPFHIAFYPPNNRWDWDAMISASKAGFDGIADAWGVNDKRFKPTVSFEDKDKDRPRTEITFK